LGGGQKKTKTPDGNTAQLDSALILPTAAANNSKATKYWDEMPLNSLPIWRGN
jgi:hypothetical protein